jgi:hypothetical protein
MTTTGTKVARAPLNADVYDALEFSALAFKGIGKGRWFTGDWDPTSNTALDPCCGEGHAITVCDVTSNTHFTHTEALEALHSIGVKYWDSDDAVQDINKRLGREPATPVTFKQWTRELGIKRAE